MKPFFRITTIICICIFLSACGIFRNRFEEETQQPTDIQDAETFSIESTTDVEVQDVPNANTENQTSTGATASTTVIGNIPSQASALDLQKIAKLEQVVEKIQEENAALKSTLQSLENATVSHRDIGNRASENEISFKQCGNFSVFQSFDWHKKLTTLLKNQKFPLGSGQELSYVTVDDITSSCYSENGEIFVFILPQGDNAFDIIRYDIKLHSAQISNYKTQHEGNQAIPRTFAKRNGNAIGLKASRTDNGCVKNITYGYNFVINETHTKELCTKCAGVAQECTEF